jgi:hypothetical protein
LVDYCEVTDEDISIWWDEAYALEKPSGNNTPLVKDNNTVYLFGHYSDHGNGNSEKGTTGKVTGSAKIQGPQTRVVFPIMNSRNEIGNVGKTRPIDGIYNEYAKVNNSDVPNNSRHNHTKTEQNYLYKGLWVCVTGLSRGDKITFGGKGDFGHESDAEWNIV